VNRFSNEPVRMAGLIAGAIIALSSFLLGWGNGLDWRIAAGTGLGEFAVVGLGAELARGQAWGPKTVDEIMDADAVIRRAEQGRG
jgi:hypothetical protein